jgi:hypothetical protein
MKKPRLQLIWCAEYKMLAEGTGVSPRARAPARTRLVGKENNEMAGPGTGG